MTRDSTAALSVSDTWLWTDVVGRIVSYGGSSGKLYNFSNETKNNYIIGEQRLQAFDPNSLEAKEDSAVVGAVHYKRGAVVVNTNSYVYAFGGVSDYTGIVSSELIQIGNLYYYISYYSYLLYHRCMQV